MRSVCRATGSARRRHRRRQARRPRPDQFRRRQARHRRRQARHRNQGHRRFLQYQAPGRNLPRLVQRHSRAC
jgi:hypothetical protein